MTAPTLRYIDSHTGGEPTRVVVEGMPDLGPGSLDVRRTRFQQEFDWLRTSLANEPRGSDAVVGALLCPAAEPDCDYGVIFFNNVGYLGMCVHGTIGLAQTLKFLGQIDDGPFRLDTPVGPVDVDVDGHHVTVRNVPSYRKAAKVPLDLKDHGKVVHGDIAWGGNWFFLVDDHGLDVRYENLSQLKQMAQSIRDALDSANIVGDDGGQIDHVELFGPPQGDADSKNFVLCPGGEYDRSPCGTGTSAKLACLADDNKLSSGDRWRQEGIVGSIFEGWVDPHGDKWLPAIRGSAFVTADCQLILNDDDPFGAGLS